MLVRLDVSEEDYSVSFYDECSGIFVATEHHRWDTDDPCGGVSFRGGRVTGCVGIPDSRTEIGCDTGR